MNARTKSLEDLQKQCDGLEDPWGGGHTDVTNSRVTFCRIYAVNAEERTCCISTYGSDSVVSNSDFTDVQWLSSYTSPDGDEISVVPRIGSNGLCVFFDGQPWLLGFFQPVTIDDETEIPDPELEGTENSAASAATNKERINEGDQIMRGIAGNRFVVRAGGEIEIEATKVCRRTYFPTENRITEICQNYESRTDGGTIDWIHVDPNKDQTKFTQVWRTDINQADLIIDERGTVEQSSSIIQRYRMGSLADFKVNTTSRARIEKVVFVNGATEYKLRQEDPEDASNAYHYGINSDGEFFRGINDFGYYESIKPTGEMILNINNNFHQTIMPDGEMTIDIGIEDEKKELTPGEGGKGKFSLNIKPNGDTLINVADKNMISVLASGEVKIDVGGKSIITIDQAGNVKIEASTKVEVTAPLVDLKAKIIKLGEAASDVVPMGRLMLTAINKFIAIFNSHTHGSNLPPLPTTTPAPTAQEITTDVLSATVKVQA